MPVAPCALPAPPVPITHPSPNHGARRKGARPDLVVIHHTAMADAPAALARLCDCDAQVSCHYLIAGDGTLWQLVDEGQRAWHAGAGRWGAVGDVNSRSIGIELANTAAHPYPEPQMRVLERLLADIITRHAIPPARVIAHSDMAPARKSDPGPRFDWRRLARQGLSVWPQVPGRGGGGAAPDPAAFLSAAARFGYPDEAGGAAVLTAFRLRFRPWAQGALGAADVDAVTDLAARFPADPGAAAPDGRTGSGP